MRSNDTSVRKVRYEPDFSMPRARAVSVAQAVPVAPVVPDPYGGASSSTPSSAPSAPSAPSASSMDEAWANHEEGIISAMKSVAQANGGSVTVTAMANLIGGEEGFPDGTGFNMTTFVNTVCRRPDVLVKAGMKFEGGVFSNEAVEGVDFLSKREAVISFIKEHLESHGKSLRKDIIELINEDEDGRFVRAWGNKWGQMGESAMRGFLESLKRDGVLESNGINVGKEGRNQVFFMA